jgi:hypothetical protein
MKRALEGNAIKVIPRENDGPVGRYQDWFRSHPRVHDGWFRDIARLDRATQGGFNRSSQHFSKGGCDEGIQAAFGSVCASSFAIARPDSRGPAGELQTVLDGDCLGAVERGCCG